ncbi:hypothetical protein [Marinobacter sp. NSM]|uniref:hypothetical protein n=1 Tax=Marinobacter sp. NSM TaxID=3458004 RepID=UPI004036867A
MQDTPHSSSISDLQELHGTSGSDFPERRSEALKALKPTTPAPRTRPRRLGIDQLHLAIEVFSFRQPIEEDYTQRVVIEELSRDLRNGQRLDPIRIVWTSRGWAVADGYLRLEAYKAVNWKRGIPVSVFNGTPAEALDKAVETNRKRSLPLTQAERADVAWFYVSSGRKLSKRETAQQSGVSQRMVGYMRQTKRLLEEKGFDAETYPTWIKARMATFNSEEELEEFNDDEAIERMHIKLREVFGKLEFHTTETFAAAVQRFSGTRFEELMAAFGELGGWAAYEAGRAEALCYAESPDF